MAYLGKKILAVVPARGGSKGIHRKNLVKIAGLSLIAHAAYTINSLAWVDHAVISTDDQEMLKEGNDHGLAGVFLRPPHLSADDTNAVDVWLHALHESEQYWGLQFDCSVLLEPTSPFRKPHDVENTVRKLIQGRYDSVLTITETDSKSHPFKQLVMNKERIGFYDERGQGIVGRQELNAVYHRNGVAYATTRENLINCGGIINENTAAVVVDEPVVNIDTSWDLMYAEWLFSQG